MRRSLILAACAALAFATAASAADLPRSAPHYGYTSPHRYVQRNWTGFYAGLNGGYGFGKSDWSGSVTNGSTKPKGALAGITLGYNLQTGSWVWGLEGDLDYSWMKGSTSSGTGGCTNCETKLPWFGTARGRLGYAGWDRWLPYFTGGAAFGNVKMTPANGTDESKTKFGWTAGVGIEYAFLGNWSAKLEYLYADLGSLDTAAGFGYSSDNVSFTANILRGGINYRF